MKTRIKLSIGIFAASIAFPLLLGIPLGGIIAREDLTYLQNVLVAAKYCYLFFTACLTLGSLLILIPRIPEDRCIIYGAVLYYGTFLLGGFLRDFMVSPVSRPQHYILAFGILALACFAFGRKAPK